MDAEKLAQKATEIQKEFKDKGQDISICEAVKRASGTFVQSFEQNIADMASERVHRQSFFGGTFEFSEAVNQVYAENPDINAVVRAEDITTLAKLKAACFSLKKLKGEVWDLQHQEILNAFDRFKKRNEKEEIAQELMDEINSIISSYEKWVQDRKDLELPPPPHQDPRKAVF